MTEAPQKSRSFSSMLRQRPLSALRDEMDELISRALGAVDEAWLAARLAAPMDLSETGTQVEVKLDVPGVDPHEIDIELVGQTLYVRGRRHEEPEEEGRTFHRTERRKGDFSRSVTLPCAVVEDRVEARYTDGVLAITLPKCEEARSRRVNVRRGERAESQGGD